MRYGKEIHIPGYEKILHIEHPALSGFIAIHSTALGPSCGGIRLLPYQSIREALDDVLRLSKGMSYKSALAGIGFGGGKSVIAADPAKKCSAMFEVFGEVVESLEGRYIAAKDMNIDAEDLSTVRSRTRHVLGIEGRKGSSGDPSPVTARGMLCALEATVEELTGSRSLSGLRVAVQGVGHVGFAYAKGIRERGGEVCVSDIRPEAARRAQEALGVQVVRSSEIYEAECDVFAPCAQGGVLNEKTIPQLKCRAVVGCANNQLATDQDGLLLQKRGILYAPDFSINSGGIINVFVEYENGGYDEQKAFQKADEIYGTLKEIYRRAKERKLAPYLVACQLAEERLYGSQ